MPTAKEIEIKEFAQRVERVCDFLLAKASDAGETGSDDILVIEELKNDAADIQFGRKESLNLFSGLEKHVKGLN